MDNSGAERNLLFGLLALQNGLIDQAQLVAAFQSWTLRKDRPLADHLVGQGALDAAQCGVVEALVRLHLNKHGGSPEKSLAGLPANSLMQDSLALLENSALAAILAGSPLILDRLESAGDQTIDIEVGPASDGASGLAGLGAELRTIITHVALHDPDRDDPSSATNGDGRESRGKGQAGRYQLMGEIARGGMGSVLRGRDPDLGRDLALKILLDQHCNRSDLVDRFLEEAQICGQLQHPGVVPVYDVGALADHRPFFAMKLVKGKNLAALLAERADPDNDLPRFLSIFEAICQTMAYAHARGVIHRDLKPSNVMVGSFGEVQVMDWGLAKVLPKDGPRKDVVARPANQTVVSTFRSECETNLSKTGSAMGTPAYMAPEQARGETDAIDRRADVFSLGSILCEILTGAPAFSGENSTEILRAAGRADTAAALSRLEHCGADLELLALAADCLRAEPRNRPADARVVAGRVTAYLDGVRERLREAELSRAAETARAQEAEAKASAERHARWLTAALAATVLLAGVLGGTAMWWTEHQRLERVKEATGRINVAFHEATRLRGLAQGAAVGEMGPWALAASAAEKAHEMLQPGVEPVLRQQVENLQVEIGNERQEAEAAAQAADRDRRLLDRMVDIRSAEADDDDGGWKTDLAYADAFREAGFDVAAKPTEELARLIKARPLPVVLAVAAAVDDWAAIRRDQKKNRAAAAALSALAGAVDPDTWRLDLRKALDLADKAARLQALHSLAKNTPESLGPISLDLLGRALKDAGDPVGAEAVLRRAQHLHPSDLWTNYDLARSLEKLARRDEAIRYYTAARSLHPETAHELAHALEGNGERAEEIAVFEDLRRLRPGNGRHLGCLGLALLRQGRTERGRELLAAAEAANRDSVRLRPNDPSAHFSLGVVLHYQGKFLNIQGKLDQAKEEYRTVIKLQPENGVVHDNLSELLRRQDKVEDAIAEARVAIGLQPDLANPHNTLGDILFNLKRDCAAAAAEFRKASELQPDNATYHDNLGLALQKQGKLDEAVAEYREAIKLQPSLADAHAGAGEIFEFQGKLDQAVAEFRTAVGHQPHVADYHNSLARAILKKTDRGEADRAEAVEHARRAVTQSPQDGDYQATLAMAEYRAGRWAESAAAGERSIELLKEVNASNGFFLAMALWRQGARDRSRSIFDQAFSWTRKNPPEDASPKAFWREAAELLGQPGPDAPPAVQPARPSNPRAVSDSGIR